MQKKQIITAPWSNQGKLGSKYNFQLILKGFHKVPTAVSHAKYGCLAGEVTNNSKRFRHQSPYRCHNVYGYRCFL